MNSNQLSFILIFAAMSQQNIGQKGDRFSMDNDQKRKRRTRNDEDGRNFSCNCGKSYLSYPALYTHVKTKHNGKAQFAPKYGFGRQQNQSQQPKQDDDIQSVQKIQDSNNIDQLKKYLLKFFPLTPKERDIEKKFKDFTKEDQNYLKSIKEYWEKRKKQDQPHQSQTYSTPIDYVLGKFLLDTDAQISKNCLKFLSEFVLNLHKQINQIKNNQQFCKTSNASQLPTLMNEIFIQSFQKMQQTHIYRRHPTIICKTIYHFNRWLFQQRFTNLSLKFNTL